MAQMGLLRFIRDDAYVWGMLSSAPEGRTVLFVSITLANPEGSDPPPPSGWQAN